MATSKTPAKKAAPRRAPAKKALAPVAEPDVDLDFDDAPNPVADQVNDYRPSPNPKLADQVPEELQFSTDSGESREPEKVLISLNGRPHYLYEPSRAMLLLLGSALVSTETSLEDRIRTMMNIIDKCLDSDGVRVVRAAIMNSDNSFDEGLLSTLMETIFNRWAPTMADELNTDTAAAKPAQNRAALRASARR
ncbi:hypothetical protein L5G28_07800 [Gordonia sp. HY285]|uniref:hypothetical protein n=1 Tax=Gordonia liuliyuniae TaxID=2911517 RepID=UPI001F449002|nr:hypothetical protein [Gordonia liuliyuniae]MCF8610065.1 hypothetical protein [Gordonia liuliyuniae]